MKTEDILSTFIVASYVDDLLYTINNKKMIANFKQDMMKRYEMNDMGF